MVAIRSTSSPNHQTVVAGEDSSSGELELRETEEAKAIINTKKEKKKPTSTEAQSATKTGEIQVAAAVANELVTGKEAMLGDRQGPRRRCFCDCTVVDLLIAMA